MSRDLQGRMGWLCFVVMGYGKKEDPVSHRVFDLDDTYERLIKPAVLGAGMECLRADEMHIAGDLRGSMFAMLYRADVVIADITTLNPNVFYELGARHVFKPGTTLVLCREGQRCPVNLSSLRLFSYSYRDSSGRMDEDEVKHQVPRLSAYLQGLAANQLDDSPVYSLLRVRPPVISTQELDKYIGSYSYPFRGAALSAFDQVREAREHMRHNNFREAARLWKDLTLNDPEEIAYRQQWALCLYKSQYPDAEHSIRQAMDVIEELSDLRDSETLGIYGAIHKRAFEVTGQAEYLLKALSSYQTGWTLNGDYYTGENYATCCLYLSRNFEEEMGRTMFERHSLLGDGVETKVRGKELGESQQYRTLAFLTLKKVYALLLDNLSSVKAQEKEDRAWFFASLSNVALLLGYEQDAWRYYQRFVKEKPAAWIRESFEKTRELYQEERARYKESSLETELRVAHGKLSLIVVQYGCSSATWENIVSGLRIRLRGNVQELGEWHLQKFPWLLDALTEMEAPQSLLHKKGVDSDLKCTDAVLLLWGSQKNTPQWRRLVSAFLELAIQQDKPLIIIKDGSLTEHGHTVTETDKLLLWLTKAKAVIEFPADDSMAAHPGTYHGMNLNELLEIIYRMTGKSMTFRG